MSFLKSLFGKRRMRTVTMDGTDFPLVTADSRSAESDRAPIHTAIGSRDFLVASSVDEFCEWTDTGKACVMFISTGDYMDIKVKAFGRFASRYGQESEIAVAMTQAKIFCTSCGRQFGPMVIMLGQTNKCAECGNEYSLFTTEEIETITKR